ncbi:molybdopterin-dependent oxidoreductase [Brevibacterium renqingii]|uniref:molybdopterin-dependent oxidoreductase n=1 Tax=Brevibacterium renqingii TaxID=2776916 RepID=UPI001ADEC4FC|nr:molybdopterin-dependent oxidoreductase [Brevibacterium renqingii]
MNRRHHVEGRARGAAAGIAAALVLFGAADLLARALGPPAAPLLTLGQTLIPLAPPAVVEPVIDLLGRNDKPFLIACTGLAALALGGLIGSLARGGTGSARRTRLATLLLTAAGLVPVAAILLQPGARPADAVPALVGLVLGLIVFRLLLGSHRPGGPAREAHASSTGEAAAGQADRRQFIRLAGVLAAAGAAAVAAGQTVASLAQDAGAAVTRLVLPEPARKAPAIPASASANVAGAVPFVTDPEDFYRIDTVLAPPAIEPVEWSLRIHGMVENEVTLTMEDVLDLPLEEHHITLTCVSNPVGGDLVGTATWLGFPVRELLGRAGPSQDADMVLSHSFDGFTASTPLAALTDERDALLAVGMNGAPLPPEHGFPARLVVPGLYGFVSATKWVTELEVTRFDEKTAYWTDRGWDAQAPILVASRIEVPKPLATVSAGNVRVGGTAWAQRSGIESVEVRLDDGDWTEAALAEEVTIDTWRQWRTDFAEVEPGSHTLTVRATDKDGTVQTAKRRDPIPNSATGHHHIQFRVE